MLPKEPERDPEPPPKTVRDEPPDREPPPKIDRGDPLLAGLDPRYPPDDGLLRGLTIGGRTWIVFRDGDERR